MMAREGKCSLLFISAFSTQYHCLSEFIQHMVKAGLKNTHNLLEDLYSSMLQSGSMFEDVGTDERREDLDIWLAEQRGRDSYILHI